LRRDYEVWQIRRMGFTLDRRAFGRWCYVTCQSGALALGCAHHTPSANASVSGGSEPGTPPNEPSAPVVEVTRTSTAPGARDAGAPRTSEESAAEPGTRARASTKLSSGPDEELTPNLLAADGSALPQTHELPRTDSPGFHERLERLVAAIARDEPELALPAFFPRVAYQQVKAIADPARDWQQRLVRAFERNIHEYHQSLGSDAAGVVFAGLTLRERGVRWMNPGSEGNRVGYYRVTRSQLRVRLPNGTERNLELTSLISWRGAWYVVHLHGFS
jgi:hypothetical protein